MALCILVPAPSIGALMGMEIMPGPVGQAIYFVSKVYLVVFPAFWWLVIERQRISWSPAKRGGFVIASALGILISIVVGLTYVVLGDRIIDATVVQNAATQNGLGTLPNFIGLSLYLITVNSLLEEYVWRWFVFRQCETLLNSTLAILASALFFTIHHVIALNSQMGLAPTVLGSIGVFIGGAVWSWCYLRFRSVWPGYVSHAIVDVAVLAVGYHLIFVAGSGAT